MLSVHDSVIQRILHQLHRDALRKLKRLNLTPCVPHLDVGVRFMDNLCLLKMDSDIELQMARRVHFCFSIDPAINHLNELQALWRRHAPHIACMWMTPSTNMHLATSITG